MITEYSRSLFGEESLSGSHLHPLQQPSCLERTTTTRPAPAPATPGFGIHHQPTEFAFHFEDCSNFDAFPQGFGDELFGPVQTTGSSSSHASTQPSAPEPITAAELPSTSKSEDRTEMVGSYDSGAWRDAACESGRKGFFVPFEFVTFPLVDKPANLPSNNLAMSDSTLANGNFALASNSLTLPGSTLADGNSAYPSNNFALPGSRLADGNFALPSNNFALPVYTLADGNFGLPGATPLRNPVSAHPEGSAPQLEQPFRPATQNCGAHGHSNDMGEWVIHGNSNVVNVPTYFEYVQSVPQAPAVWTGPPVYCHRNDCHRGGTPFPGGPDELIWHLEHEHLLRRCDRFDCVVGKQSMRDSRYQYHLPNECLTWDQLGSAQIFQSQPQSPGQFMSKRGGKKRKYEAPETQPSEESPTSTASEMDDRVRKAVREAARNAPKSTASTAKVVIDRNSGTRENFGNGYLNNVVRKVNGQAKRGRPRKDQPPRPDEDASSSSSGQSTPSSRTSTYGQ